MLPQLEALVLIVLGLLSLLLGKRLFWLFAGIVGFALGWWLTGLFLPDGFTRLAVGLIAGLILGGLARFLGAWAIRIVAAAAGFVILPMLLDNLGMLGGLSELLWAVIGAMLGFVFALFVADWTLIFLSAVLGAGLILNGLQALLSVTDTLRLIIGFVLIAVGVIVQSRQTP